VWPPAAYEIIRQSGLEPPYQDIVPTRYLPPLADRVFPAGRIARAGEMVKVNAAAPEGSTLWFAPEGSTSFATRPDMSRGPASARRIAAPTADGHYRLHVMAPSGQLLGVSQAVLAVGAPLPSPTTTPAPSTRRSTMRPAASGPG
jgi:hypothetical protein